MVKGRSKKPPVLNDMIEHTCNLNGRFEGKVVQLLSQQFIYETKEGWHRHCMFWEDWKKLEIKND